MSVFHVKLYIRFSVLLRDASTLPPELQPPINIDKVRWIQAWTGKEGERTEKPYMRFTFLHNNMVKKQLCATQCIFLLHCIFFPFHTLLPWFSRVRVPQAYFLGSDSQGLDKVSLGHGRLG